MGSKKNFTTTAIQGGLFLSIASWFSRGAIIITVLLLARLLTKEEYAISVFYLLLINFLDIAVMGLQAALIQKKELKEKELDVAWTFENFILKNIVAVFLYFNAHNICDFFEISKNYILGVQLVSLTFVIKGIENLAITKLTHELEFKKRSLLEITKGVVTGVVSVTMIFFWKNPLVVVIGVMAGQVGRVITAYWLYPKIHSLSFNVSILRGLLNFGVWIAAQNFLFILKSQIDKIFVSKILGVDLLGVFQLGSRVVVQSTNDLTMIVSNTLFPIISKIQHERERIIGALNKLYSIVFIVALPLLSYFFTNADLLTVVLFGSKWLDEQVPLVIQLSAVAGVVKIFNVSSEPILRGIGRPQLDFLGKLVYVLSVVLFCVFFLKTYLLKGLLVAIVGAEVFQSFITIYALRRFIGYSMVDFLKIVFYPMLVSALLCSISLFFSNLGVFNNHQVYLQFLSVSVIWGVVFLFLLRVLVNKFDYYMPDFLFKTRIGKIILA